MLFYLYRRPRTRGLETNDFPESVENSSNLPRKDESTRIEIHTPSIPPYSQDPDHLTPCEGNQVEMSTSNPAERVWARL